MNLKFKTIIYTSLVLALNAGFLSVPSADAQLITSPDGESVYDSTLNVFWLANANLAASEKFGIASACTFPPQTPCINPDGSMDYTSAQQWVSGLNANWYGGRNNWTLPFSPTADSSCEGRPTGGTWNNSFGFGCTASALGSLFYRTLGGRATSTAVRMPAGNVVGPFRNLQPYLYWSIDQGKTGGHKSFSFNTAFDGSNTDDNYLYVLPKIRGGTVAGVGAR
jgi:hypothetical protein